MSDWQLASDRRGVSEIFGSILIISIVLLVAVSLIGFGYMLVGDSSDSADDRTAQDSMEGLGERLDGITADELTATTEWEPPEGTASDFDARPDEGMVNITAKTNETYWQATADTGDPGDLVDADEQLGSEEIQLGTIVYEGADGEQTAFQGGGLFHDEAGTVEILRDPGIDIVDGRLDLSLTDISSVEHINEDGLVLEQDTQDIGTSDVQQIVNEAMMKDDDVVAPAHINATVTTDFAEGWETYANSLDDVERVIHGEDHSELDDDQVRIVFGEFGEGILLGGQPRFDSDVVYSGLSEFGPELYNENHGELEEAGDGYRVDDPDEYTTGISYNADTRGQGQEWWAFNGTHWVNVEDPTAEPLDDDEPTVVDDVDIGDDEFEIEDDAWSTVVDTTDANDPGEFREFIPNATEYQDSSESNGSLAEPIDVDVENNWESYVGSFRTLFTIDEFEVSVFDDTGNELSQFDPDDDELAPDFELEMQVDGVNDGFRDARDDEIPVAFLSEQADSLPSDLPSDPSIIDGARNGTDKGESFNITSSVVVQDRADSYQLALGTGTPDDAAGFEDRYDVADDSDSEFNVSIESVDDAVEEGENVTADIAIGNEGAVQDTQSVWLWGEQRGEEMIVDEDVTVDAGDIDTVEFEWETELSRDSNWDEFEAYIPASSASDTAALDVESGIDPPEFTIDEVRYDGDAVDSSGFAGDVREGEEAVFDVEVTNEGDEADTQAVDLRLSDAGDLAETNQTQLTLDAGETDSVAVGWQTLPGDAADEPYLMEMLTDDDEYLAELEVLPPAEPNFDVTIADIDDPVLAGDEMTAAVVVTNTGAEAGTQDIAFQPESIAEQKELQLEPGEQENVTLSWDTDEDDVGLYNVDVFSEDSIATAEEVQVEPDDPDEEEFEVAITETNEPVTEGAPLTVDVAVTNTGEALGSTPVALKDFDGEFVNVTQDDVSLESNETTQRTLTWHTLVGTAGEDGTTDEIAVEVDGDNVGAVDTEEVEIEPREAVRDPVDVSFVIDETGSMGRVTDIQDSTDASFDADDPPESGEYTVPEGEVWGSKSDECRQVFTSDDGWERYCDMAPVQNGPFWTPGQTIDFDEFEPEMDGEFGVFELPDHGFDPDVQRIPAVKTAIDGLNESKDRASALRFDTHMEFHHELTDDLGAVEDSLTVGPLWATNIAGGTDEAIDHLIEETELEEGQPASERDREQVVIVLTDGVHNHGEYDEGELTDYADDRNFTDGEKRVDIPIYTVGFGAADEDELTYVSNNAGSGEGEFRWGDDPDELEDIFEGLVEEITEEEPSELQINQAEIDGETNVPEGETVTVETEIEVETVGDGEAIVPVTLLDNDDNPVDSQLVDLEEEDLESGDTTTVDLTWDTSGAVDGETSDETLTVVTSEDSEEVSLTVEDRSAEFTLELDGYEDGIQEGEVLSFDVTVVNDGQADGAQRLWIETEDGETVHTADSETIVDAGDEEFVQLEWVTDLGDSDVNNVQIRSEDDSVLVDDLEIDEFDEAGTFEPEILSDGYEVEFSDRVDVDVSIENVDGTQLETPAEVNLTHDGDVVDTTVVLLSDGEQTTETLSWLADESGTNELSVEVTENTDTVDVWVDDQPVGAVFEVGDLTTNADDGDDSIASDEAFEIEELEIENTGDEIGSQEILLMRNNTADGEEPRAITTLDTGSVSPNETTDLVGGTSLSLQPSEHRFTDDTDELVVRTEDGNTGEQDIDISAAGSTVDVSIDILEGQIDATEESDAAEDGDVIDIPVEIENEGSDDIQEEELVLSFEKALGSDSALENITQVPFDGSIDGGEDEVVTIAWDTSGDGWDADPWEVTMSIEDESDQTFIYVEEDTDPSPGGSGLDDGGSGIGIDIDEIEVS